MGPEHRKLLHDPISVAFLWGNDPEKLASALLHIAVDEIDTQLKKSQKTKKKRKRRKRKSKISLVDIIKLVNV